MLLKLLKLKANDAIISGATATSSRGSVTRRKIWKGLPPSTLAASVNSSGMDWSAPMETRKKYGVVSQTLTKMTASLGQVTSGIQLITLPPKSHGRSEIPMLFRIELLTTPKLSLRRPRHTSSERKPGTAYGMIITER